jgi:hypothetical protein
MVMADAFNALDLNTKSLLNINSTPDHITLSVYPNPTSGIITIDYTLKATSEVFIVVSDVYGKQIKVIERQLKNVGSYSVKWNSGLHQDGTYLIKVISNNSTLIKKVILMR